MSSENPAPAPGANPLVRWFVVGLPLGLLIMGALSFVIYFRDRRAKEAAAAAPSRYASMLRKDLNLDDYRRYIRIFEQEIGPRTADKPENIEAAQSFIESTLGFGNMGYQVVRREFEMDGRQHAHLEAELPGQKTPEKVIIVIARYDGSGAREIAGLLMLAHAFTGTEHRNTIRFVALFAGSEPPDNSGFESFRKWAPDSERVDWAFLDIETLAADEKGVMAKLFELEDLIRQYSDAGVVGRR